MIASSPIQESESIGDTQTYCNTRNGQWVCAVKDYVRNLDYGEIVIRVHGGKVVQVHKTEKIQFT